MKEKWTTENIPDLTGRIIIVTGANSGIGLEETREFARHGATVIMACRDMGKAQAALNGIKSELPRSQVAVMQLNLASQKSVRLFAEEFKTNYVRLDLLVANAGIMAAPYTVTEDGFESQLGTNHLGHFSLVGLLIDLLLKTPGSRIVSISSIAHRAGKIDFDNLMFENGRNYSRWRAYGCSKLANLLFAYELQRRLAAAGAGTISVAAHPGIANTNLMRYLTGKRSMELLVKLGGLTMQNAAMGAFSAIRAAVDPNVRGGDYYGPDGGQKGYPVVVKSSAASYDEKAAARLWEASEKLTGISYPI